MTREEEIQRRFRANDPLNLSAVQTEAPHLLEGLWEPENFIGWRRTLEAAGVAVDAVRIHVATEVRCVLCRWSDVRLMRHYETAHSMNIAEVRKEHPDAEETCEELRAAARISKLGLGYKGGGTLVPHWEPAWSMRYAQDRLRWLHDAGIPVNYSHVANHESGLGAYVRRVFGTWDRGLESVGLVPAAIRQAAPARQFTREQLLALLRRKARKSPADLHIRRARTGEMKTVFTACLREFGSYEGALAAVDVNPPDFIPALTDPAWLARRDALLAAARERVRARRAYDAWETAAFLDEHYPAVEQFFGVWAGVAAAIGCQERDLFPPTPFTDYSSEAAFIAGLHERKAAGLPLKEDLVRVDNVGLLTQSMRLFGSWSKALKAAGVKRPQRGLRQRHFTTSEDLLDALRSVAADGLSLRHVDVMSLPGHAMIGKWAFRYFGSWAGAIKAAGLVAPERKPRSRKAIPPKPRPARFKAPEEILDALRERARLGLSLETRDMLQSKARGGDSSLMPLARKAFGTYAAALKAAGLHRHFERPFLTKIEIGSFLRRLHKAGIVMSHDAVVASKDPDARFLIRSIRSHFPEFKAAVAAAGLPPLKGPGAQSRFPDKESIVREIQRRREAGEHPEIGMPHGTPEDRNLYDGARKHHGSWTGALQAAGLEYLPGPWGRAGTRSTPGKKSSRQSRDSQ